MARPVSASRLRVLHLTNMYPTPGRPFWGIFVKEIVDSLDPLGVQSTVFLIDGQSSRLQYLAALRDVRRLGRSARFDLVHAHYGLTGLVAIGLPTLPVVTSLYGSDVNIGWQRSLSCCGLLRARRSIVCSRRMQERLPRWVQPHVIPPGIDLRRFCPRDRSEARARFQYGADEAVVLFPASPSRPVKDHPLFQAALARVGRQNIRAVTLGGVEAEELPFLYSAVDCLVLTSKSEGSPTVIKEAVACGCPVVSVDVGDVTEQLKGIEGCHVTQTREPAELAARINDVLQSDPRQAALPRLEHLSLRHAAKQVLAVYQEALSGA